MMTFKLSDWIKRADADAREQALVERVAVLEADKSLVQQLLTDIQAREQALREELELEKAAHQYTRDMERPCGLLLMKMNQIVAVPDGSSLFTEIKALVAREQALRAELDKLRQAVMLAVVNIDCERNGLTPDSNLRERLVKVINNTEPGRV